MNILRYLPLLFLAWAMNAFADDNWQGGEASKLLPEVEAILASTDIGLNDLFRIAELTNPDMAVARIEIEARNGRMQQAGMYPNPEFLIAANEMYIDDPSFHKLKVEISQSLPLGGRLGAATDAARVGVEQARENEFQTRRMAFGRVQEWWADQIYFREMDAAFVELVAGADRNLAMAQARFESKAAPEAHVTRAMLEIFDLQVAQQQFQRNRVRSEADMKILFGGIDIPAGRLSDQLYANSQISGLSEDDGSLTTDHPALREAKLGVVAAEAKLKTARKERIPDLNFFVAYGNSLPTEEKFVEGGISFPLPIFSRNQGRILETKALVAMARHEEKFTTHRLESALSLARSRQHTTQQQRVQLTEQILPAAERTLIQAQEAYRLGRVVFLELVDAQRTYKEVLLRTVENRRTQVSVDAEIMSLLGLGPYADHGGIE